MLRVQGKEILSWVVDVLFDTAFRSYELLEYHVQSEEESYRHLIVKSDSS